MTIPTQVQSSGIRINVQSGTSYTAARADMNGRIAMTNFAANVVTMPQASTEAVPVGSRTEVEARGLGSTTIGTEGSDTIQSMNGDIKSYAQFAVMVVTKLSESGGISVWGVSGETGA